MEVSCYNIICKGKLLHISLITYREKPFSEISLWNKDTLEKNRVINVLLKLSGNTYIDGNKLYITSHNISGIGMINLEI